MQRSNFIEPNKDLTKEEYEALIQTAYEKKKIRLCLLIQTICATGIRVSEVVFITVEYEKTHIKYSRKKCKIVVQ